MPESYNVKYLCKFGKAKVVIDDKIQGTTPFYHTFEKGVYNIKASLEGYEDYFDRFLVDEERNYYIHMKKKEPGKEPSPTPQPSPTPPREKPKPSPTPPLEKPKPTPESYNVKFLCNFGKAKVVIDDTTRGTTPFEIRLSRGHHIIKAY